MFGLLVNSKSPHSCGMNKLSTNMANTPGSSSLLVIQGR